MNIKLELTDQEQANLINMLDMATKAGGLNVAQIALPLVFRIQQEQQRIANPPSPPGSPPPSQDAADPA